jgi:predicted AlkP superfamily pyrophosphatase or phosphodiesterase
MLSGVAPARHGIDWNSDKPEKGVIQVPTVFDYAKKAKLSTAMIVGKSKLSHLMRPGTVDHYIHAGYTDSRVGEAASRFLLEATPNLCFIHFPGPDSAGHAFGWISEEQIKVIEGIDAEIGKILSSLRAHGEGWRWVVLLTADHGGHEKTHGTASEEDMTIPWICSGIGIRKGYLIERTVSVCDTAATALFALGVQPPDNWDGHVIEEVFAR